MRVRLRTTDELTVVVTSAVGDALARGGALVRAGAEQGPVAVLGSRDLPAGIYFGVTDALAELGATRIEVR